MAQDHFELSQRQQQFFDTFGFLALPGLVRDDIPWIIDEFEAVWQDRDPDHDGSIRSILVPFIDQREKLCTLLDHPVIAGIASGLLGPEFNYVAGDGNYYTGSTPWHSDSWHEVGRFIKIALYLDPVDRDTGCLRVIPGSHLPDVNREWGARQAANSDELWGIGQEEVPCMALATQPGDVVVFNHNIMHASFGGGTRRRMFTINLCNHCETPEELEELKTYIGHHKVFWIDHMHSRLMRESASEQRMRHLRQVIENEAHLAQLSAEARAEGLSGFGGMKVIVPDY